MSNIWSRFVRGVVLAGLLLCAATVHGEEVIRHYDSRITVLPSGALDVEEIIVVQSEGKKIRHGIFRDFQTVYQGETGRSTTSFAVKEVKLDGASVPWQVVNLDLGKRLRIGDGSRLLPAGTHEYSIRFRTKRQLIFLPDRDELTYQAIAYGWDFPILNAQISVSLPNGVAPSNFRVSAGAYGAGEGGATVNQPGPGVLLFSTKAPLMPKEGVTVALTWPAGHVARPTASDKALWFLKDNIGVLLAVGGLLVVFFFYLWAWVRVGRDPHKGAIIAQYEPPRKLSPAAARFVIEQDWDDTAFSAAIVNLAVRGALRIDEVSDKSYVLHREKTVWQPFGLSSGEKALLKALFQNGDSLVVKRENHKALRAARKVHERALEREHLGVHFIRNRGVFIFGVFLSVAFAIGSIFAAKSTPAIMVVALVLLGLINPVFSWLLRAPTLKGRKLMDEIEGFKRYLNVAEKDRMNFHNPPERTPELFERYLPYAIALGVEQKWGEQFDDILKAARDPETGRAWHPHWYHGQHFRAGRGFETARFAKAVGAGMASSFQAAAMPPSSKSGSSFGGGGFSGGMGGGGGGGGGW